MSAVLMQLGQPVAFLSKALGDKHKQLSISEKKFLALIILRPCFESLRALIREYY